MKRNKNTGTPKKNKETGTSIFLGPVQAWFSRVVGCPTKIQSLSWPRIAAGESVLLLAPTGSGKTLAAFLACLDRIWRSTPPSHPGVRILYISPLKALNQDIRRNLSIPLSGVLEEAEARGTSLRPIRVGVRTGDTTAEQRRALNRNPPEILITTPESLHLLLTSEGRENLRQVETVILDEIHSLCPNKRGAFLSLLMERLESLRLGLPGKPLESVAPLQRIGLSATQKPLDEVARFLVGLENAPGKSNHLRSRPVTILDAGSQKSLDVQITWPQPEGVPGNGRPESIWPGIHEHTKDLVLAHHSTIVFANNRRSAEKITAGINDDPAKPLALAHHGSISLEKRLAIEESLKAGALKAVIATSSLEMGIDMGPVNLVVQVESPGSVASAIQRIGRAGHLVGQVSKGRILPKTEMDLAECAALIPMVIRGEVEPLLVPTNPLDILAQQIVSAVAMDCWPARQLFECFRRAYPYHQLTPEVFDETLAMVSGRFLQLGHQPPAEVGPNDKELKAGPRVLAALQPKIHHDRSLGVLEALPGTKANAIAGGGAIPDTGNYAVIGPEGTRVGELDEEFVYERRIGDAFLLGTTVWRIKSIEPDRVLVTPSPGTSAVLPFWRGEGPGRSLHLGRALGNFLKQSLERIDSPHRLDWLEREHGLDRNGARHFFSFITRQVVSTGMVPHRNSVLVEAWRDPLGDWQIAIINLLGSKFNRTLQLGLESRYAAEMGHQPSIACHDDGILIRLPDLAGKPENPLNLLRTGTLKGDILNALTGSPLFAIRFRHNAVRALLVQRGTKGRRAPLWLQRLRGKDLYQVLGKIPHFPLVHETIRECMTEQLEIKALTEWLDEIRTGITTVHLRQADSPSPFCREITWQFTAANMYQPDEVRGDSQPPVLDAEKLDHLIGNHDHRGLLPIHPDAISQVDQFIRFQNRPPRSMAELATSLHRLGDLIEEECGGMVATWLHQLVQRGSVVRFKPSQSHPELFLPADYLEQYEAAFRSGRKTIDQPEEIEAITKIVSRFLDNHTLINLEMLCARYPVHPEWASQLLEEWVQAGKLLTTKNNDNASTVDYSAPEKWDLARKISLGIARKEFSTVSPAQFCQFLFSWHQIRQNGKRDAQEVSISRVACKTAFEKWPADIWENGIFPSRAGFLAEKSIDQWAGSGNGAWVGGQADNNRLIPFALISTRQLQGLSSPVITNLKESALALLNLLKSKGPSFGRELMWPSQSTEASITEALMELVQAGLVTNDRLAPIRAFQKTEKASINSIKPVHKRARMAMLRASYQMEESSLEGRWAALPWGHPSPEEETTHWAMALMDRFGILTKELANIVPNSPAWKNLYKVLDHLELAGEIRRGHFVEGLQGAQFALPEAVEQLANIPRTLNLETGCVVLHAQDPANIHGPGRVFEFPQDTQGETRHGFTPESWVAFLNGLPIAVAQKNGKRVDFFTQKEKEINQALTAILQRLASIAKPWFKVETCGGEAAGLSPWRERLEKIGMVADHLAMAYHRS